MASGATEQCIVSDPENVRPGEIDLDTIRWSGHDRIALTRGGRCSGAGEARLRILFIAGYVRSGSTLLSSLLGDLDRCISLGEMSAMVYGPETSLDDLCMCGHCYRECEFWRTTWETAFPGKGEEMRTEFRTRLGREAVVRSRLLGGSSIRPGFGGAQGRLDRQRMIELYEAAASLARAEVIVDASKTPAHGLMLIAGGASDLRPIHLVRHPCAVAFSQSRRKVRHERTSESAMLPRRSLFRSAAGWLKANTNAERLMRTCSSSIRLRYEELIVDPKAAVERIAEYGEVPMNQLHQGVLEDAADTTLTARHDVAGNPSKFEWQKGTPKITPDLEWMTAMPYLARWLVTALTYPWLRRYGYLPAGRE